MPTNVDFRQWSPWAKLGTWALLITAGLGSLQLVAWGLGWTFNVFENGTPLLVTAILSLLMIMSWDQRPLTDYGLFVGPTWKKLWLCGIAGGLVSYGIYLGAGITAGAFAVQTDKVSLSRFVQSFFTAMTALPLAVTQQLIFSGYLLSMLRDRNNRWVAVGISAALFALLNRIEDLPSLAQYQTQQLMLGLFLVASMLCVLRMITGSILIPAGLLAGWVFVRRFVHMMGLVVPVWQSEWINWFAPGGDARQAPLLAILVGTALLCLAVVLRLRGEGRVPLTQQALDADFKRVFPLSHSSALATLDVWLPRLWQARFQIGLDYLPRTIVVLAFSAANTLVTLPERLVLACLRPRRVEKPLFIVGSPRSGTTHLHNLLALDPQFATCRSYHMMNPAGSVLSGWLIVPLMAAFLPWRRPMDSVRFHVLSPQEEEFMMAGLGGLSPYWAMSFPKQWPWYARYLFPDRLPEGERRAWMTMYQRTLQRIAFWSGKRLLLKNPYNTGRVAILKQMYPESRFIHINRHPYDVFRSNMHLAREGHVCNQLQDPDTETSYQTRFLEYYREMETACLSDLEQMDPADSARVQFEAMESDPVNVIRQIYVHLGLDFTPQFENRLHDYLSSLTQYRKNEHRELALEDRQQIERSMSELMDAWGYGLGPGSRRAA